MTGKQPGSPEVRPNTLTDESAPNTFRTGAAPGTPGRPRSPGTPGRDQGDWDQGTRRGVALPPLRAWVWVVLAAAGAFIALRLLSGTP
jgi:hypothetical protein